MASDLGLLGVGSGVIKPDWVNEDRYSQEQPEVTNDTESRDQRLVKEKVVQLASQTVQYSQAVDLPSIPANTRQAVDISITSPGVVKAGDNIVYLGSPTMDNGLVPSGSIPALTDDTARVYVTNVTAGALDDVSMTHYFIIHRL